MTAAPSMDGELRLRVTGMTCAGCAASVQRAVESEPGVTDASVSVTEGLATINGAGLSPDRLIEVIRGRGFDAEPLDESTSPIALRSEIEERQIAAERMWQRRAAIGLSVWLPLEALHWFGPDAWHTWLPWVMAAGATLVLATAGAGFYASAWNAAKRRTSNMDTLIAIGATTAWAYSLVILLATRVFGADLAHPMYFAESAALLGIISLGHWMEARAAAAAGSAVRDLLHLQPDVAHRMNDDGTVDEIDTMTVRVGDRLRVRAFERVPVDGVIVDGVSDVDESLVTGEPLPVRRTVDDPVVAGTANTDGTFVFTATSDGRHTTLSRIADLVQHAQTSRAPVQRLADRICAIFVPTVLTIASLSVIGWALAGDLPRGLIAAVTVLIISCPCALGLATPMAVMVGTGAASRRGILFRSAASIERAGGATRVVFDKTGTLTTGNPRVSRVALLRDTTTVDDVLRTAASVEAVSEHPIARAIVRAALQRGLELRPISGFRAIPGEGVIGTIDGRRVEIMRHEAASCEVRLDDVPVATLTISDSPRDGAAETIRALRRAQLDIHMISGDRRGPAEAVGEALGIAATEIDAEATPASKLERIESFGDGTIMVGDGVNDAAALARADLGIAMHSGTNIAIEAADVIIPGERIGTVAETVTIARRTVRCIRQNLAFAFLYNAAAIPAAALGLLGEHGPLVAAIAMACSDLTVIGNALRLRWILGRLPRVGVASPRD